MDQEYQVISIVATSEQNQAIYEAFSSCGIVAQFVSEQPGYHFSTEDVTTLIVAILGGGGVSALISAIVQHYKTKIITKFENGRITELEIDRKIKKDDLVDLVRKIKETFGNNETDS